MSRARQSLIFKSQAILFMSLLCVMGVHAQEFRGLIVGQVTDPSGAVVPNATITAVKEGSEQTYTAQSNSGGNFSIPYVQPGVYTVMVTAPGFKKALRQG